MTKEERDRLLSDGYRNWLMSRNPLVLLLLLVAIVGFMFVTAGGLVGVTGLVEAVVVAAIVLWIWRRRLRRNLEACYPDGSVAESELIEGRLRLVDAVATTEIALALLRKPRVVGTSVTVLKPGGGSARIVLPRVLVPDEVLAALPRG
ncbi:hypothetical protein GCM10027076_05170 [Nocardioides montaniterrae]